MSEREKLAGWLQQVMAETANEGMHFLCPGCGDDIVFETPFYLEWGGPNIHECGWVGEELKPYRISHGAPTPTKDTAE